MMLASMFSTPGLRRSELCFGKDAIDVLRLRTLSCVVLYGLVRKGVVVALRLVVAAHVYTVHDAVGCAIENAVRLPTLTYGDRAQFVIVEQLL